MAQVNRRDRRYDYSPQVPPEDDWGDTLTGGDSGGAQDGYEQPPVYFDPYTGWTPSGGTPRPSPASDADAFVAAARQRLADAQADYASATTSWAKGDAADRIVKAESALRAALEYRDKQGPKAPKHASTANLEPVIDPNTGQKIALRDPISGQQFALPRPSATSNKPTALPNDPYLIYPDGSIRKNEFYQSDAQKPTFLTPSTTAPYLMQVGADGSLTPIENINYHDPSTDPLSSWQQAQIEQQRMANQTSMQNNLAQQWAQLVPRMAQPGQVYYSGYEPGGIMSQIFGNMGMNYNPESYRAPIVNYDPAQFWNQAQQMTGQGG